MGIGNALKGVRKAVNSKNVALVTGGVLGGVTLNQSATNATAIKSSASPDVVIISEGTANNSTAKEGTWEYITAMMLLNGTGGANGRAGIGGNGTDTPTLNNPEKTDSFPTLPVVIAVLGAVVVAGIVVFGKKKGGRIK